MNYNNNIKIDEQFNNKSDFNNFEKLNKNLNNIEKMRDRKPVKVLQHHECIFEHINTKVRPSKKTGVSATFTGVRYRDTKFQDTNIRYVLNEAIEKYLNYNHLGAIDEADFVKFVNEKFHIEVLSIDSIKLKVTQSLEQELDSPSMMM